MTTPLNDISSDANLPPLPAKITTRHGAVFDPRADEWSIASIAHGKISFRFGQLETLGKVFIHKFKLALAQYAITSSESHFHNIGQRFWAFYRSELSRSATTIDAIEMRHLINYRGSLDETSEWKLGLLRILFLRMEALGYGICTDAALQFLRDSILKSNIRGTSIRTRDPEAGAFSDSELLLVQARANEAYATKCIR